MKTKKEQVFEILDKQGYILDDESAKIFGFDNFYSVLEYERMWKRRKKDRDFFNGKLLIEKRKGHRCHLIRTSEILKGQWYKVGKDFYNEVKCRETK